MMWGNGVPLWAHAVAFLPPPPPRYQPHEGHSIEWSLFRVWGGELRERQRDREEEGGGRRRKKNKKKRGRRGSRKREEEELE